MITVELITFSLLSFTWFTKGIPISNRSSGYGSGIQLSREYLPVKNSKINHQHLGYHYDNKVIVTTNSPLGVIPIISNDYYYKPSIGAGVSQSDTKIYGPTGVITEADGIVELETPTRPVQEVSSDGGYQTFGEYTTIRTKTDRHTFVNTLKLQEGNEKKHLNIAAQTVASAITTLDWLLDDKGYNSPIHPPPSPILALILSKYGRYLPVTRGPRVYPYMAANNIHNSQPFGQYKWSCEQDIED